MGQCWDCAKGSCRCCAWASCKTAEAAFWHVVMNFLCARGLLLGSLFLGAGYWYQLHEWFGPRAQALRGGLGWADRP